LRFYHANANRTKPVGVFVFYMGAGVFGDYPTGHAPPAYR